MMRMPVLAGFAVLISLQASHAAETRTTALPPPPRGLERLSRPLPLTPEHAARKAQQSADADAMRAAGLRDAQIVGGGNTSPGKWPFMVALVSHGATNNFEGQFCGASLIHPYWVLTAAHCVDTSVPGSVDVVVGAHDLRHDTNVLRIAVDEILVHPAWNPLTSDNDVALLRLSRPVAPPYTPVPIIDDFALDDSGILATVIGWGNTSTNANVYPDILQEAQVPIVSNATANLPASYGGAITDNMIPAGYAAGGVDSCQGDSGGPLLVPASNAVGWVQVGVVSWGNGCAQPGIYGIYTRLAHYRSFIYGQFLPGYGAWEEDRGVTGEYRDSDTNGVPHFLEYAFRAGTTGDSQTNLPRGATASVGGLSYPATQFRRPAREEDAQYTLGAAAAISGPWQDAALTGLVVTQAPTAGDAGGETIVVRRPAPFGPQAAESAFLRIHARPTTNMVATPRRLAMPGHARHTLTPADGRSTNTPPAFIKHYRLAGPPSESNLFVVLRSTAFPAQLELRNADTMALLAADPTNSAGGTDDLIAFTPRAGTNYLLSVSGATTNDLGAFLLAAYRPTPALPVIAAGQTNTASLSNTDALDPLLVPETYYKDDYRLVDSGAPRDIVVSMNRTSGTTTFAPYVYVLLEETGQPLGLTASPMMDNPSALRFRTVSRTPYIVRASSFGPAQTNSYRLVVSVPPPAAALTVPAVINGTLAAADPDDPRMTTTYNYDAYTLTGVPDGSIIRVTLTASTFDAWLVVMKNDTGVVVFEDGFGDIDHSLIVPGGSPLQFWVTSTSSSDTGNYTFSTEFNP